MIPHHTMSFDLRISVVHLAIVASYYSFKKGISFSRTSLLSSLTNGKPKLSMSVSKLSGNASGTYFSVR